MTIREQIENAITEIFIAEQEKRGILSGDCEPLLALDLDDKMDALAEVIEVILKHQQ